MNRNSNSNNFTPLPGARRSVARASYHNLRSCFTNLTTGFQACRYPKANGRQHFQGSTLNPDTLADVPFWELFRSFPAQPHRMQQINGSSGSMRRGLNPMFGEIVQQPPPRTVENPNSAVLSKLKKEVYEPPKILQKRVSLCYEDSVANALKERDRGKQERRKRCAICLEDFEPREEVMLTHCKHAFHEDFYRTVGKKRRPVPSL